MPMIFRQWPWLFVRYGSWYRSFRKKVIAHHERKAAVHAKRAKWIHGELGRFRREALSRGVFPTSVKYGDFEGVEGTSGF